MPLIFLYPLIGQWETASWHGNYQYEAFLGENVAEDQIIIEYTLKLADKSCSVTREGYQTNETLICSAHENGEDLEIKFKSYEGGSITNIYGVSVYPPQSILFKLTKTDGELITTWGLMAPDETNSSGKFFSKVSTK